jgi:hypothetical protein
MDNHIVSCLREMSNCDLQKFSRLTYEGHMPYYIYNNIFNPASFMRMSPSRSHIYENDIRDTLTRCTIDEKEMICGCIVDSL